MPATTKRQFRWLHTADALKKLGEAGVKEWIGATHNPGSLPESAKKKKRAGADYMRRMTQR